MDELGLGATEALECAADLGTATMDDDRQEGRPSAGA